jgi:general secretion pathway protein I
MPGGAAGRDREAGFTLVEMMVALAVFSLAALALLRLEGATVKSTGLLQDQAIAQMVARNIAVETLSDPVAPAFGEQRGTVVNAGRQWTWLRRTGRSPEPRIQMIDVVVRDARGRQAARLTLFRRAAR